mmetsp:Transcript_36249/g.73801  ORF Transcript_36249/g.73801 Transcript_36249/m.73801 type:complete len:84 (+) Transcript_36249:864-1115(+)
MAGIVMIATNMNVTSAMKRSAQSALRKAMAAINVKIVTKFSATSVRRLGCLIAMYAMADVAIAMIVDFKNFDKGSGIAQNASD